MLSVIQPLQKLISRGFQDEIYQIADINKHDVIIYDLDGNYLVSNKEKIGRSKKFHMKF
jgi:hypothetical protein